MVGVKLVLQGQLKINIKEIQNFPIDVVLFTGVAGAVNKELKQWDIILSEGLIQHDMDARPILINMKFLP